MGKVVVCMGKEGDVTLFISVIVEDIFSMLYKCGY